MIEAIKNHKEVLHKYHWTSPKKPNVGDKVWLIYEGIVEVLEVLESGRITVDVYGKNYSVPTSCYRCISEKIPRKE